MEDPQDRYRLLTKIYLTRRGMGKNPDKLWNYLAVGTASDPVLTVSIPDYVAV